MSYAFPLLSTPAQIHFEDFDAGGALYHGNYLRVLDRARSAYFTAQNLDANAYFRTGVCLVVGEARFKFLKPIFPGDEVEVQSQVLAAKRGSFVLKQTLLSKSPGSIAGELAAEAKIVHQAAFRLTCVDWKNMRPLELTPELKKVFGIPAQLEDLDKAQQTLSLPEL